MLLRRFLSIAVPALAISLAGCGDDDDDDDGGGFVYTDDGQLQVMTRNLYLGADLNPVLEAGDLPSALAAATDVWTAVQTTNDFRVRAVALADEIAAARPDLVGLQEVSRWRTQTPSDLLPRNATTVAFDFLAILQNELVARGVPYDVAAEIDLFDFEAPVFIGTTTDLMDVRLTDRQVILAIQGLPTSNPRSDVFSALVPIPVLDPTGGSTVVDITRGWTAVDATVGGKQIAFYNTHLEAFGDGTVRNLQANELRGVLDAEPVTSVVLVGDLNSDPNGAGGADSAAYNILVAGLAFRDLWTDLSLPDTDFTCCFDPDLTVSAVTLSSRIDHILWKGTLPRVSATRVGEDPADRVGSPQRWPSDHAGVVGVFDP